jgi:hypothetical protein
MANTGYKKATIAYKIDTDGRALDVNGQLCSVSGRKQAIALRQGFFNPNPALYEVEKYFTTGLDGEPTETVDLTTCPVPGVSAWVLDGGTWHTANYWYDNRLWTN